MSVVPRRGNQELVPYRLISGRCSAPTVPPTRNTMVVDAVISQIKYKDSGKKEMSSSLYSTLSDTSETSFAREMTDMQSEVNI